MKLLEEPTGEFHLILNWKRSNEPESWEPKKKISVNLFSLKIRTLSGRQAHRHRQRGGYQGKKIN